MQFMLRFLRIMRDYAPMLAATNYAQYYAGIMYASLLTIALPSSVPTVGSEVHPDLRRLDSCPQRVWHQRKETKLLHMNS